MVKNDLEITLPVCYNTSMDNNELNTENNSTHQESQGSQEPQTPQNTSVAADQTIEKKPKKYFIASIILSTISLMISIFVLSILIRERDIEITNEDPRGWLLVVDSWFQLFTGLLPCSVIFALVDVKKCLNSKYRIPSIIAIVLAIMALIAFISGWVFIMN
jgi:hypothetical protein